MTSAQRKLPTHMTVDEFIAWTGDGTAAKYELVDGELRAMAPATTTHGSMQATLSRLLGEALMKAKRRCRVLTEPGVAVRNNSRANMRIPDIGITWSADNAGQVAMPEPVLLVEIMSPSNKADTMINVWAYTTIPSLNEILVVQSTRIEAQLYRRQSDDSWPEEPETVGATDHLNLDSARLSVPLKNVYALTYLDV